MLLCRLLLLLLVAVQEAATMSSRVDSWAQQRADLRRSIFGGADLPARSHPDEVTDVVNAAADMVWKSGQAVAVLLTQRLIGAKAF